MIVTGIFILGVASDLSQFLISDARNFQKSPNVAWGGENFLVVWKDARIGGASASHIFGTRVTPDGDILDPLGIIISNTLHFQRTPSVVWGDQVFLVVWQDHARFCRFSPWCPNIYGSLVDLSGKVLNRFSIPISEQRDFQGNPKVSWSSEKFLVVWGDSRSGNSDIYGTRISQDGSVLDPLGIPISTEAGAQYGPSAASDGSNFFVVWSDSRSGRDADIYGGWVNPDGSVIDPIGFPISTAPYFQTNPSIAWDGSNFLVVWDDDRSCNDDNNNYDCVDIFGARLSPSGSVIDPEGIPISTASNNQLRPSVAWNGENFLVVWEDYRHNSICLDSFCSDIYGARVNLEGEVLDPDGILISAPISTTAESSQKKPQIASNGKEFLIVWEDFDYGSDFNIYGALVTFENEPLPESSIFQPKMVNINITSMLKKERNLKWIEKLGKPR